TLRKKCVQHPQKGEKRKGLTCCLPSMGGKERCRLGWFVVHGSASPGRLSARRGRSPSAPLSASSAFLRGVASGVGGVGRTSGPCPATSTGPCRVGCRQWWEYYR